MKLINMLISRARQRLDNTDLRIGEKRKVRETIIMKEMGLVNVEVNIDFFFTLIIMESENDKERYLFWAYVETKIDEALSLEIKQKVTNKLSDRVLVV